MHRIYPLPPSLINQIAAGEVIERPASVVKELLENALDAQAHHIEIRVEAGGLHLIEINDDGIGIEPDDLPLAVMSHTTSKIRELNDLFTIQSLGFRGEALASIASVSHLSLISKTADQSMGYALTLDNATPKITPQARVQGTTIHVRDLFFNTPVRRQFLSTEKTEWLAIETVVKRAVLSRFDVGFQLHGKSTSHWPAATTEAAIHARVKKIFGAAFMDKSEKIHAENNGITLRGWIGKPSLMRSQNDLQYVYLNSRMIRDKVISHAIRAAYEQSLYPGRQPVVLLYLDMPPELVDVNVHPTKHEVRFREPRQIHDFIVGQILKALNSVTLSALSHIEEPVGDYTVKPASPELDSMPLSLQWLTWPYCLIHLKKETFLCDYIALYQAICRQRFMTEIAANAIITRPLLFPQRLAVNTPLGNEKKEWCEEIGLLFDQLDETTVIIRAFPSVLPYLNIEQWFKNWTNQAFSQETLIDSLIHANQPPWPVPTLDWESLQQDTHNLLAQGKKMPYFRRMTMMDWKKILTL